MRAIVLPFAAWLGVLQAFVPLTAPGFGFETIARLVVWAGALGSLTVGIYRLGVWRQDMENTKNNVHAVIERIERQLEAFVRTLTAAAEQRAQFEKWQVRTERRLHRLETEGAT
jgi:hypothetical protein